MQHGVFTYYLLQAATKGYHVLGLFSDRLLSGRCITNSCPIFQAGYETSRGEAMKRIEGFTARIDLDVLEWLKSKGEGYQTRLNAIPREAMTKDLRTAPRPGLSLGRHRRASTPRNGQV
jgi:hypothetical protein